MSIPHKENYFVELFSFFLTLYERHFILFPHLFRKIRGKLLLSPQKSTQVDILQTQTLPQPQIFALWRKTLVKLDSVYVTLCC